MSAASEDRPDSTDAVQDDRLEDLEAAEAIRAESRRLDRRFELTEAILLSIAALLAAWAGFQSAKWSGEQADSNNEAAASRVESTRWSTVAGQQQTVDVITFTQWLQAAQGEGLFSAPPVAGETYVPDATKLSGFLYQRFRPEFKVAVDAWIRTSPRLNPAAPPTPFEMAEYQVAATKEAARLEQQAADQTAVGRAANEQSDSYVLMTIMFATVLFFAGISSKMDTFRARVFLLGTGCTLLVVAAGIVASFPKDL